ncbi:ACP S-malonyltransferase [Oceanisphaera avium]|uniref:Malonyl CoA-acyl carrier protein transacylase n=1 Tax=Oceanisphaera avium TaxID=1903694 RepID=A0A1Y0CWT8_9GAMM|nr:ACP S-malonyltransferase [Oceanisphaera avium]ART79356.1 [acyl-carrier-protein] S-malonyltransferase [Oceanisphaera avium]
MTFAITFPGQGSQTVGMLSELFAEHDIIKHTFAEASASLGYDLSELVLMGPAEALNQTWRTQPALLTASVAIWRLWREQGGAMPDVMAGHSLGEYSALVCAEVLSLADAVKLVELRGQLMQEAVPEGSGAMSAIIGLDNDTIIANCALAEQGEVVSPVNFNSPGQVVIAGNKAAVERANILMKESGAKRALPLPVSVPSHCALMRSAAEKLEHTLTDMVFNEPVVSVINNVDVAQENTSAAIKDALVRQLYSPVRWTETVEAMVGLGVTLSLEFGPGKVLSGLAKRIDKRVEGLAVNDNASLERALADVAGA